MKMPIEEKLGLGVGLDLTWGSDIGFDRTTEKLAPQTRSFLQLHHKWFNYSFISFQPRDCGELNAARYLKSYKEFFEISSGPRALHHTILNLGCMEAYDRSDVLRFTNELITNLRIRWINEDLGIWSIRGHALPYPLPPFLTVAGVDACVHNCVSVARGLKAPLVIEFPGFSDGHSFTMGNLDAFDVFSEVANQADIPVVLDVGHLLSWLWITGKEGKEAFKAIDSLPLERCFELHLSGSDRVRGKFLDLHHGVLLDEQIDLTALLLVNCPNLKAVTYEDPRYNSKGQLISEANNNAGRLKELVDTWSL